MVPVADALISLQIDSVVLAHATHHVVPLARSMYCNDQIRPDNCGSGNSLILSTERRYCLEEVNETNQTEAYALCL